MGEKIAELAHRDTQKQDNAPLFVSLYIVLLAFFIMLNTIATPIEDKTDQVMDSVKFTFSYEKPIEFTIPNPTSDESGSSVAKFFSAIEQFSKPFLTVNNDEIISTGDMIQISVPNERLFTESLALKAEARQLLQGYSEAITDWREGYVINMEALVDSPPQSLIDFYQGNKNDNAVLQAGRIARFMEKDEDITPHIAVGLRYSKENKTRFRFTMHPEGL